MNVGVPDTWLRRLLHVGREYLTHWAIAGTVIALTGFAPEHWFADLVSHLAIPESLRRAWPAALDIRIVLVAVGVAIIAWDALRRSRAQRPIEQIDRQAETHPQIAGGLAKAANAVAPASAELAKTDGTPELALPHKATIAILPFDNMSGDANQEYFADGITEDIITALSKNRWLSVIARNSTFAFKGHAKDVRRIAQELGADYVVEGSVRKVENRVRITVQLIDAASGNHVWAEHYDRNLEDIFAVQDEVTGSIAARIEPELGAVERQRSERKSTQNLNAWDCYHLGMSHMYKFDGDGNVEAQRLFRRAIDFDPKFAEAYARLAYCIVLSMVYFDAAPTVELLDDALLIAKKAALLDDKDAFAHLAIARVHLARGEYDQAMAECEISVDLNPTFAQGYCAMGDALAYAGRLEESISQFEKATHLSPQDPWRWAFFSYRSLAYIFLGQHDKAAEWARNALRVPNCQYWANAHLVAALGHLNKTDEARIAVAELLRRKPEFSCSYAAEHLFYVKNHDQAEHYLEGLRKAGLPA